MLLRFMISFALFLFVVLPLDCLAQEPRPESPTKVADQIAALILGGNQIERFFDEALKAAPTLPGMQPRDVERIKNDSQAGRIAIVNMQPEIQSALASILSVEFSERELIELHSFLQTPTGRKLVNKQPLLLVSIVKRSIEVSVNQTLDKKALKGLAEFEAGLNPDALKQIQKAKSSPKIDRKLISQTWYGEEKTNESVDRWIAVRRADGSRVIGGVYIDAQAKTYEKYRTTGRWLVIGRLLIEIQMEFPTEPSLFILDEATPNKLSYRFVDPDSAPDEWITSIETRNKLSLPPKPAGYEDVSQE